MQNRIKITSRQRVKIVLQHKKPDRIPLDRLSKIANPSKTIFVADSNEDWQRGHCIYQSSYPYAPHNTDLVGNRHSGGANVLFLDGHVKWHLQDVIDKSDWWDRD